MMFKHGRSEYRNVENVFFWDISHIRAIVVIQSVITGRIPKPRYNIYFWFLHVTINIDYLSYSFYM